MTTIQRSALVPYSAAALYQLVNDVETYPQFMEGCVGAQVLKRTPDTMEARLDLAKGGTTLVVATHDLPFARDVASRAGMLENGALVREGTV